MSELAELYQQVILDHNKSPHNFRRLEGANRQAEGFNPLCGDHYIVYAKLEGDRIRELAFVGSGCAISKASASIMALELEGKTLAEAKRAFETFHGIVTSEGKELPDIETVGRVAALAGVREFPMRVKCATLAWHTLRAALQGNDTTVCTE